MKSQAKCLGNEFSQIQLGNGKLLVFILFREIPDEKVTNLVRKYTGKVFFLYRMCFFKKLLEKRIFFGLKNAFINQIGFEKQIKNESNKNVRNALEQA